MPISFNRGLPPTRHPSLLMLSVEPSLNVREELAAGHYCGDDTRVR